MFEKVKVRNNDNISLTALKSSKKIDDLQITIKSIILVDYRDFWQMQTAIKLLRSREDRKNLIENVLMLSLKT